MGLHEEALLDFNKAIEMRPNWALYYCNRAKLYLAMNKK
jgi:tetratricopeptide (TPR) repeat protein